MGPRPLPAAEGAAVDPTKSMTAEGSIPAARLAEDRRLVLRELRMAPRPLPAAEWAAVDPTKSISGRLQT